MNNKDKIFEKIQKLLKLSENNPSIQEAASAAARAQQLMDKYSITKYMLEAYNEDETTEKIYNFGLDNPLDRLGKRSSNWKSILAVVLARVNSCEVYTKPIIYFDGSKEIFFCIIGTESDASQTKYLYSYLTSEIEKLCKRDNNGYGKSWSNNFKIGAVHTIREKLNEAQKETIEETKRDIEENNPNAIVHLSGALARIEKKQQDVKSIMENLNLKYKSFNSKVVPDAFRRGKEAAEEIDLNPAKAKFEGNKKQLQNRR